MIRAIRIRLYPTPDQKKYLAGLFGAVRFCFNKALYLKTHFYKVKGVNLHPIHDLKKLIAIAKNTKKYAWLAEYDCMALQESVRNLNKAYSRFFKKEAGYPRFKSRRGEQSSYHCTGVSAGDDFVKVPKMKKIKAVVHRRIEGKVKSITLSMDACGDYWASVLYEDGLPEAVPATCVRQSKTVGVDEVGFLHDLLGGRADGVVHLDVELRVAEQGAHGREEAFGLLGVVVLDRERFEARDHALRHGMLREEDRDLRSGAEQVGAGGQEFNGAQAVFGAVDGNENVHKFTSSALFASSADRRQAGPERGTSCEYHACFFCFCLNNLATEVGGFRYSRGFSPRGCPRFAVTPTTKSLLTQPLYGKGRNPPPSEPPELALGDPFSGLNDYDTGVKPGCYSG